MGSKHLSSQAIKMIHELHKEGKLFRDIAQIVGCAPSTVSNVLHRLSVNSAVICHSCRKTISGIRGAKFCPFCGSEIDADIWETYVLPAAELLNKANHAIIEKHATENTPAAYIDILADHITMDDI